MTADFTFANERVVESIKNFLRELDREMGLDGPISPSPIAYAQFRFMLELEAFLMVLSGNNIGWVVEKTRDSPGTEMFLRDFLREVSDIIGAPFPGTPRPARIERLEIIEASYLLLKERTRSDYEVKIL